MLSLVQCQREEKETQDKYCHSAKNPPSGFLRNSRKEVKKEKRDMQTKAFIKMLGKVNRMAVKRSYMPFADSAIPTRTEAYRRLDKCHK